MSRAVASTAAADQGYFFADVRVFDPRTQLDHHGPAWLSRDGQLYLRTEPNWREVQTIDVVKHAWLVPGLVDLHARMREPGATHKASIASEARCALANGVTSLACPPDTIPCIDSRAIAELIIERARGAGAARVHPLGALTRALGEESLSEMASLRAAGCLAMSNADHGYVNSNLLRRALQYAATLDLTVFLHPIDRFLSEDGCAHDGPISARLGLPGIPESAETLALARDLMLIEETGVRAHISRISCARSVEMIAQAKKRGLSVTADVAITHLYLNENDLLGFRSNFHLLPPLRTPADRDALRAGVASGVIDAICSDHAPHDRDAKLAPFPQTEAGASTLDAFFGLSLQLVHDGLLSAAQWLQRCAIAPAQILQLPQRDWILLDPNARHRVDAATLLSRGKNSPFLGWELQGQVLRSFIGAS